MREQELPPRYGGWRRARGIGLAGLSTGQTFTVLGAIATVLAAAAIAIRSVIVLGPALAVLVGVSVAGWDGLPLLHRARRRLRWVAAGWRGETRYRGAVLVEHPSGWRLPGVLAHTRLLTAEDGRGGRYGLVADRRRGILTATLRVAATSTWLANQAEASDWVANWGAWLASLGHLPMVRWVTVTVDSAPEPGSTLRDRTAALLDPAAPAAARQILWHLVAASPAAAAVTTRVSISFDPAAAAGRPKDPPAAIAEVGHALTGLESALGGCGVTVLGRATAAELAGAVRAAFDPAARGDVDRVSESAGADRVGGSDVAAGNPEAADRPLDWGEAGPVAAEEGWDSYRHDSGTSVSWAWREAPRPAVPATVLARLLTPGAFGRRVSVQYRPLPAGAAARLLEEQVNAAAFAEQWRRRTGREATARDSVDQARARQAAAEEAAGAGVTLICLYVTTTVADPADLARAVADTEARAEAARIRLRRLYGAQATGFATTLPCGICPPALGRRTRGGHR